MVSTDLAIGEFEKIVDKYSERCDDEKVEGIIGGIERLRTQNPAVYDERAIAGYLRERGKALRNLVDDYCLSSISSKFPLISNELFGLKRHLTFTYDKNVWRLSRDDTEPEGLEKNVSMDSPVKPVRSTYKIGRKKGSIRGIDDSEYGKKKAMYDGDMETYRKQLTEWDKNNKKVQNLKKNTKRIAVPLFAYTPLFDGSHVANLGGFKSSRTVGRNIKRINVDISAKLPGGIGPNLKEAYRDALGHYFSVLSNMFTNPVAGDVMYNDIKLKMPEVGAIWIPTLDSLNVKTKEKVTPLKDIDPAMILKVGKRNFLVKTWMVDDEEPFEGYLREFSVGDLKRKL